MGNERTGVIGMLVTWIFNLIAIILKGISTLFGFIFYQQMEVLQIISLYLAIIVSLLTIVWYIGNMIIKKDEFFKALKNILRKMWR